MDAHFNPHSFRHKFHYENPDGHRHLDGIFLPDFNPYQYPNEHGDSDEYPHSNSHAHGHGFGHPHGFPDAQSNIDGFAFKYCFGYANRHPCPYADRNPDQRGCRDGNPHEYRHLKPLGNLHGNANL